MKKKSRQYRVVSFLKREELDFLDDLMKDIYFKYDRKISRGKLIEEIIATFRDKGIDKRDLIEKELLDRLLRQKSKKIKPCPTKSKVTSRTILAAPAEANIPVKGKDILERRKFHRLSNGLDVSYRTLESLQPFTEGQAENISELGVKVLLPDFFPPDTRLELSIRIPGRARPLLALGRVVWVRPHPTKNFYATGVLLVHIPQADKGEFIHYVLEAKKERKKGPNKKQK